MESFHKATNMCMIIAVLCFLQGICLIPSWLIAFLVKERRDKIKHQQLVSGGSTNMYWLSHWLIDSGKHVLLAIACFLIVLVLRVSSLTTDGDYGVAFALFALFGTAVTPFCCLISFFFDDPEAAQWMVFEVLCISGIHIIFS
jgi:ATP-binding cassette subfamily A (ABC1) protein 3